MDIPKYRNLLKPYKDKKVSNDVVRIIIVDVNI